MWYIHQQGMSLARARGTGDNREAFIDDLKDYELVLPQENESIEIA